MSEEVEEDKRGYLFRYIEETGQWGFITVKNTNLGDHSVAFIGTEEWQTEEQGKYLLCHVMYSKTKTQSMIDAVNENMQTPFKMTGTDVCQVMNLSSNKMECVVSVPHSLPEMLDITVHSTNAHCLVKGDISFIELKQQIRQTMGLTVINTRIHQHLTHYV